MTNILLYLRQHIRWLILIGLLPVSAGAGFFMKDYFFQSKVIEMERLKNEFDKTKVAYEKLQKEYTNLDSDRQNILVQTKRFLQDKNRLPELQLKFRKLTKDHRTALNHAATLSQLYTKLRKRSHEMSVDLERVSAELKELQIQYKETADSNKALEKAVKEKLSNAPEFKQFKNDITQLKAEKSAMERDHKKYEDMVGKLKKEVSKKEIAKQKIKELERAKSQLEKEVKKLKKDLKRVPKNVKTISNENHKLIKENASMHYNLGVFYVQNRRFDRAIEEFKKCIDLDPSNSKAHYNLGFLYSEHYENHALAEEQFREYLTIEPDDVNAEQVRSYLLTREVYDGKIMKE